MTTKPHVHALLAQGGLKKFSGYIVCMAIHVFFPSSMNTLDKAALTLI